MKPRLLVSTLADRQIVQSVTPKMTAEDDRRR
jgi:hypothetical protein